MFLWQMVPNVSTSSLENRWSYSHSKCFPLRYSFWYHLYPFWSSSRGASLPLFHCWVCQHDKPCLSAWWGTYLRKNTSPLTNINAVVIAQKLSWLWKEISEITFSTNLWVGNWPFQDLEEDLTTESNQLLDVGDVDGTNPSSKYCHVFSVKRIAPAEAYVRDPFLISCKSHFQHIEQRLW